MHMHVGDFADTCAENFRNRCKEKEIEEWTPMRVSRNLSSFTNSILTQKEKVSQAE